MRLLYKSSLAVATLLSVCIAVSAQERPESSFYLGIGGGYNIGKMSVSKLDDGIYPSNKSQGSGIFDVFLQYEFGRKKEFGVRLEVDFLKRGGTLDNIYNTSAYSNLYVQEGLKNISYNLRSSFTDIRLPLIYQFCGARSTLRPYVYIAPILALSTGGRINVQTDYNKGSYAGSHLPLTKGNMKDAYFAGSIGVGLKYDLNLFGHPFYLGLEANYTMGFTDTYSSKEKSGEAVVKDYLFSNAYDIQGSRRFNGFEVKGSIIIPFSVFCKKRVSPVVEPVVEWMPEPVVAPESIESEEEIPCKSIDEILVMTARGQDIHGVTFCSIDDINFETGKSVITPESHQYLNKVASILKRTGVKIEVKGHTDNTGTPKFNSRLSRDRAVAVVNYLKKAGVPASQLSYSYYGETCPIKDNSTEYGRSINRRVEFEIK